MNELHLEQMLPAVVFVGARVAGLMVYCPFLASDAIPTKLKAALVLLITIVIYPLHGPLQLDLSSWQWVGMALQEVVIGLVLGLAANFMMEAPMMAGQILGVQMGYTLSMVLQEESQRRLKDWAIEILATDLNERSLAHAKNAVYGAYSTRHLTPYFRQKYFMAAGDQLQVQPQVSNSVTFSRLNLSDDARMTFMKSLDVIFCCNVLIYFDLASKRRVIQHFYNNLLPHGYLFLGHSESLYGVNDDFRLVHLPGATGYIKGNRTQGGK